MVMKRFRVQMAEELRRQLMPNNFIKTNRRYFPRLVAAQNTGRFFCARILGFAAVAYYKRYTGGGARASRGSSFQPSIEVNSP
jgi:hypothetical protein